MNVTLKAYRRVAPAAKMNVASLTGASEAVRGYIEKHGLRSSDWAGGKVVDGKGKHVATISYNGRIVENA
jgi:hypothetical protein